MYVPAEQKTNTDRTNIKDRVGNNQLDTFVDGRESAALQRALVDSIHQSAPKSGAGVVQRNKGDILDAHPELIGMPAQSFMRRLDAAAIAVQKRVTLEVALQKVGLGFLYRETDTLAVIEDFINTWNQGGETDFIDVISFFRFKDALGEATPTERALAHTNSLPTVDADVTYIGQDNGNKNKLNAEILNFAYKTQKGEVVVPQFLTLDLARKHQTWTQQGNEAFITHLTSPYIKICNDRVLTDMKKRGIRPSTDGFIRTGDEVLMLLHRGYKFVEPCLLLSPVLYETGVDVRRLQRMGIQPSEIALIVAKYGAQEGTVTAQPPVVSSSPQASEPPVLEFVPSHTPPN